MNICVPYKNKSKSSLVASEIMIDIKTIEQLVELKKNQLNEKYTKDNKRLVFNLNYVLLKELSVEAIIDFYNSIMYENKVIRLEVSQTFFRDQVDLYEKLYNNKVDFFISKNAAEWNDLHMLLALPVTDIYVTEDLCFNLPEVADYIHSYGRRVRVYPNVVQNKYSGLFEDYTGFFIRPDDVFLYEPYVDTLEIWGVKNNAMSWINIYDKNRRWAGPLNEIIIGLKTPIDNRDLGKDFGLNRMSCGRRCIRPNSKCQRCKFWVEFAQGKTEQKKFLAEMEAQIDALGE